MGWEIMNHPSYIPDSVPNYFHLSGPVKMHLGGQKFQIGDELKCSVLIWLWSQDKTFYDAGISNLPGMMKKMC
jgi:hypothetical protein